MELSWQTIQDIILVPLGIWVVWVTRSIYMLNKDQEIAKYQYQDLKEDLKEIKELIHDLQHTAYNTNNIRKPTRKDLTTD